MNCVLLWEWCRHTVAHTYIVDRPTNQPTERVCYTERIAVCMWMYASKFITENSIFDVCCNDHHHALFLSVYPFRTLYSCLCSSLSLFLSGRSGSFRSNKNCVCLNTISCQSIKRRGQMDCFCCYSLLVCCCRSRCRCRRCPCCICCCCCDVVIVCCRVFQRIRETYLFIETTILILENAIIWAVDRIKCVHLSERCE